MSAPLPDGVELRPLEPHHDERGVFTELFREEWGSATEPVQWNAVRSVPGVMRGVHVHELHHDYLTVISGAMVLGLCDLRPESPTHRAAVTLALDADEPCAVAIPPGVAHGFYFPEACIHVYAVSHYWNTEDELGCRWDDVDLGIPWTHEGAEISDRDAELPPLEKLIGELADRREAAASIQR